MIKKHKREDGNYDVTFSLPPDIWAHEVYVVGDWDWNKRYPMTQSHRHAEAIWTATVTLKAGAKYCYLFLVDGSRIADFRADGHEHNDVLNFDCSYVDLTNPDAP